ncbi:hypothetical protein C8R44DRAFT_883362 [Mycena epipterygia]|nr:hypothetical protein C8R44DRAFT_883362 [Mycena epipterygia]
MSILVDSVHTSGVTLSTSAQSALSRHFVDSHFPSHRSSLYAFTINGGRHGSFTSVLDCAVSSTLDSDTDVSLGLDWKSSLHEWYIGLGLSPANGFNVRDHLHASAPAASPNISSSVSDCGHVTDMELCMFLFHISMFSLAFSSAIGSTSSPLEFSTTPSPLSAGSSLASLRTLAASIGAGGASALRRRISTIYSTIILTLAEHDSTKNPVQTTPGVRRILATYWTMLLRNDGVIMHEGVVIESDGWTVLFQLLMFLEPDVADAANYEEILDGAGGLQEFASLLVKHIRDAITRPPSPVNTGALMTAAGLLRKRDQRGGPFNSAMLSHGVITALVNAVLALQALHHEANVATVHTEANTGAVFMCLLSLMERFHDRAPKAWIIEALDAGLLSLVVSLGMTTEPAPEGPTIEEGLENVFPFLQELLGSLLPKALIYYPVIFAARKTLPRALVLANTPEFTTSSTFQSWQPFAALVEQRLAALAYFDSPAWISFKACENMQGSSMIVVANILTEIDPTTVPENHRKKSVQSLRRVSLFILLLSRMPEDGLAFISPSIVPQDQAISVPIYPVVVDNLTAREKSYIRALIQWSLRFPVTRKTVLALQVQFMFTYPGVDFFTIVNYTRPLDVQGFDIFPMSDYASRPDAPLRIAQLHASGGRLQLYCALVDDSVRMFPVWSSSSKLHDGLGRILNRLQPGLGISDLRREALGMAHDLVLELQADPEWHETF